MIEASLFEGQAIRLTSVNLEEDLKIESAWTYNLDYARHYRAYPVRPLAPHELKKHYEQAHKQSLEGGRSFHFALRMKQDDRLVGFIRFQVYEWNHAVGEIVVAIGEAEMRAVVEPEALQMGLMYVFEELNLHRVSVRVPEYEYQTIEHLEAAGFVLEFRKTEFLYRAEHYWDLLQYGMLASEWQTRREGVER